MQSLTCTRSKSKQDLQQQQARHISNSNLGMLMQQKQMHHAAKAFQCRLLLPVQVTPQAGDCFPSSSCGQVTLYPKCVAAGLSHDQQGAENVWLQVCPTTSRVLKWDFASQVVERITFVRLKLICWTPSSKSFMWWAQVGAATERPSTESPTTPPQRSWQNQVVTKRAGDQSETWSLAHSARIVQ